MNGKQNKVIGPVSTGGAGTFFEQHVDAYFLSLLLVRAMPPVLKDCQLNEVHIQTKRLHWQTDDLVAVGITSAGEARKLACQIKMSFTVSSKDPECRATIAGMWHDFQEPTHFSRGKDAFAIITLHGTDNLLKRLRSLLDCARASQNESDFAERSATGGYLHNVSRRYARELRQIVDDSDTPKPTDRSFWQFLCTLHVLSLDLDTATAKDETYMKTLLAQFMSKDDGLQSVGVAWNELLQIASDAMSAGKSLTREDLPASLRTHYPADEVSALSTIGALQEHSAVVLAGTEDRIGAEVTLGRDELVARMLMLLEEKRAIVITGPSGYGKSVLGRKILDVLHDDHLAFAFRAEEFALPHLDEVLQKAHVGLGATRLFTLLGGQARKIVLIDSVERLLEASVRDAFSDFVKLVALDDSWRIVFTCRDYSVNLVCSSLLARAGLPHEVVDVPPLNDAELDEVVLSLPQLERPLRNPSLRALLRNPYVLDMAARMKWSSPESLPNDERSFRRQFWQEIIRCDQHDADGMPARRDAAFKRIALDRARTLKPYVTPDNLDEEAIARLRQDGLVASPSDCTTSFAPSHDVLEDWAILEWIHGQFASNEGDPDAILEVIESYPALRRGYRSWLGETLECDPSTADAFVLTIVGDSSLPAYFRDDTIVSLLLSSSADAFLQRHRPELLRDDAWLLFRAIHLLRLACVSPLRERPSEHDSLSLYFVPIGRAWRGILRLVEENLAALVPDKIGTVLGLLEDWAKGGTWWTPTPAGYREAAKIAFNLLPYLEDYAFEGFQKRTLRVIAQFPSGDETSFRDLLRRTSTGDRTDVMAKGFANMLLTGTAGTFACRYFPDAMIRLSLERLCFASEDDVRLSRSDSFNELEPAFGFKPQGLSDFFPASAWRGPFRPLLRFHPAKGIDFIIRLCNHSIAWYAEGRSGDTRLEPAYKIRLDIPGRDHVIQWANPRLWCLYRGTSVGPDLLKTALMALEAWLLERCGDADSQMEDLLLRLLAESNNVAITAVVASVSNAYPLEAGQAATTVLSCREFFSLDLERKVAESQAPSGISTYFPAVNVENSLYDQERKQADLMPHRGHDLETLAMKLQSGERRDEVWRVLDDFGANLPPVSDQSDEDLLWRLALHRMDLRSYDTEHVPQARDDEDRHASSGQMDGSDVPEESLGHLMRQRPVDQDIQAMLDRETPRWETVQIDTALFNWGVAAWRREDSDAHDPETWSARLKEDQERHGVGDARAGYTLGGPGYIAAVCVRDHWDEMGQSDKEWCVNVLVDAIEHEYDSDESILYPASSSLNPSCAAAFILPAILDLGHEEEFNGRIPVTIIKAIMHHHKEVVASAAAGVGSHLCSSHVHFAIQCAGALALKARLRCELDRRQESLSFEDRLEDRRDLRLETRKIVLEVRAAVLERRFSAVDELVGIDLSRWPGQVAIDPILAILAECGHEDVCTQVHTAAADAIVREWQADHRTRNRFRERNHEFEHQVMERVASFLLRQSPTDAVAMGGTLLDSVERDPGELAYFVRKLIIAEDKSEIQTAFWPLWEALAKRVKVAKWLDALDRRYSIGEDLVHVMFLGVPWREGVHHWERLDGFAYRLDNLFQSLPPCVCVLEAYCKFLNSIGRRSLPNAFVHIAERLSAGKPPEMLSRENTVFALETLLQEFVYGHPHLVKKNAGVRSAVLVILNELVEIGSSAAFRLRDDFVTPSPVITSKR